MSTRYGYVIPIALDERFDAFWKRQEKCHDCGSGICQAHSNEVAPLLRELGSVPIVRAQRVMQQAPLQLTLAASIALANH